MGSHRGRGDEAFQESDLGRLMLFQDREDPKNSRRLEVPKVTPRGTNRVGFRLPFRTVFNQKLD
jgi:hypothetical protein